MEGNDIKQLTDGCEKDDETGNKKNDKKVDKEDKTKNTKVK